MHIGNFEKVKGLMAEREKLDTEMQVVNKTGALGVTIQGRYQDSEFVDEIKPIVISILRRKKIVIEEELIGLGITFDQS